MRYAKVLLLGLWTCVLHFAALGCLQALQGSEEKSYDTGIITGGIMMVTVLLFLVDDPNNLGKVAKAVAFFHVVCLGIFVVPQMVHEFEKMGVYQDVELRSYANLGIGHIWEGVEGLKAVIRGVRAVMKSLYFVSTLTARAQIRMLILVLRAT